MTQEEKQLLLKDLCARLPYGVMVSVQGGEFDSYKYPFQLTAVSKFGLDSFCKVYHPIYTPFGGVPNIENVKPYLRPMSSMTETEEKELCNYVAAGMFASQNKNPFVQLATEALLADFFNKHHIDYRELIPMGLALEAPKDMYKTE